jgi:glycosyltransferase involved in cell wall biosynthesis
MPVVYRLGEVFVLPSRGPGETWGLAINEAMACGRAVVASEKVGCAPDLIENRENGFVFPANDRTALQEILRTLINDETLRLRMGHASEERIQEWSIERAAKRHEEAILKHLGEMKRV